MGQGQSKDELLYQQAIEGNCDGVKALCREGAGLEWMDKDGKTALIVASMDMRLYLVAKTLIQMGANVNAYRPGRHAGTPLHHAAKRGLDLMVMLLLNNGANAFVRNDDCQTPLDVARAKGHTIVVRAIEGQICYYSGHARELAPGFFGKLVSDLLGKKCWAVVVPCNAPNPNKPLKLELVLYPTEQDAQPNTVIPLWKSNIEDPKFHQSDPVLTVYDPSSKTRHKFGSAIAGDKQQLRRLFNACKGISQLQKFTVSHSFGSLISISRARASSATASLSRGTEAMPIFTPSNNPTAPPSAAPSTQTTSTPANTNGWGETSGGSSSLNGWSELITPPPLKASSSSGWAPEPEPASEQHNGWSKPNAPPPLKASSSGWAAEPTSEQHNGWAAPPEPSTAPPLHSESQVVGPPTPSAPPLPDNDGLIQYPRIDSPAAAKAGEGETESCCVICWEAPVEGACIPCGHMAGCMGCLNQIKANKGDCPVCRAKIAQVIRLYAV